MEPEGVQRGVLSNEAQDEEGEELLKEETSMTFLIGNPSRWGSVAKSFINGSEDDVVGLCETQGGGCSPVA